MATSVAGALEDITTCGSCKMRFNDTDQVPKMLQCKHVFCLKCIHNDLIHDQKVYCLSCWHCTPVADSLETNANLLVLVQNMHQLQINGTTNGDDVPLQLMHPTPGQPKISENCVTHAMPHISYCPSCQMGLCRVCSQEHSAATNHQLRPVRESGDQMLGQLQNDCTSVAKLVTEMHKLEKNQQDFLRKVLEACTTLKRDIEFELKSGQLCVQELTEVQDLLLAANHCLQTECVPNSQISSALAYQKHKLQSRYKDLLLQCRIDELISNSSAVFDFPSLKEVLQLFTQNKQPNMVGASPNVAHADPVLFLANYCLSRLYPRHVMSEQNGDPPLVAVNTRPYAAAVKEKPAASPYPLYYFNLEINGMPVGRFVVETRPDVAPRMAGNFEALVTHERGVGYEGCSIFQCWKGESLITGDFEYNNGRGGHSIYEGGHFTPDDTKLPSVRGAVGMRRSQKRHDSKGSVGSQFRIVLQDMPGFTAIFGRVVEGLELIEKLSQYGDASGTPTKTIAIVRCGKL